MACVRGHGILALLIALALPSRAIPTEVRTGDRLATALTGGRVIAAPGQVIERGVVVLRGGMIEAVGPEGKTAIPPDARIVDVHGSWVHAAFIEPFISADRLAGKRPPGPLDDEEMPHREEAPITPGKPGPAAHPLSTVHAEHRTVDSLVLRDRVVDSYRRLGFAVVNAVPQVGILRGMGTIVTLGDGPIGGRVVREEFGQHISLEPARSGFGRMAEPAPPEEGRQRPTVYPASKMGAVALVRQAFRDALWWRDALAAYTRNPAQARPKLVLANAALLNAAQGKETVIFETTDVLSLLRAAKISQEFKLKALYVGSGDEYRLRDEVSAIRPDLILRVDFPKPERLDDEVEWLDVPLDRLRQIDRAPSNPKWLKDAGLSFSFSTASLENPEDFPRRIREAMARGLPFADVIAALTTVPARQLGLEKVLGSLQAGKVANLVVSTGQPFSIGARVSEIWIDGKRHELPERKHRAGQRAELDTHDREPMDTPLSLDVRPFVGREAGALAAPKALIIKGATLWTQGSQGVVEGADLVAVGGKVTAIGKSLSAPPGALVLDAKGRHVTPGIIDAHSHTGIDGNVNEGTHNVTAEVRIKDVFNPFDVAIYRELAGGTTAANVLHGSANAIGGQSATVKWRWGGGPDDLPIAAAPEGIKFALGENPKRSNFEGPTPRYPHTRMGVMDLIAERFAAARDYLARQEEYRKAQGKGSLVPPAPDLQLESIAEVLQGKRRIHCHSYRKDEILEMMRVAEQSGVRVGTFQHVLEGYKVADEMAHHGAGGSTFSDWWAYKVEAYDAIPYNGALMRERGVLVSFNSDSAELARRLNFEAAKAVKYGGLGPADALSLVTLNSAKQLGVDNRIGSLEVGKDADFVLWSGDPLATSSIALQTWIEGKKYFDRAEDLGKRSELEKERADLIAVAKKILERERRFTRERGMPPSNQPEQ